MKRGSATLLMVLLAAMVGVCQGDQPPEQQLPDDGVEGDRGQVVVMRAVWPDGDLANTSFRIFADREMRVPMDVLPAPEGEAMIVLQPGEYYVMAVVDANGNNAVDAGDGFGFYGVSDLAADSRPLPLTVEETKLNSATIPILMVMTEDGRLAPLPSALQTTTGALSGRVAGLAESAGPTLVLALPVGMQTRPVVTLAAADGAFELEAPVGTHLLVAIADGDDSLTVSAADSVAILGSAEAPIVVETGATVALDQPLELAADHVAPEGMPALIAGRITGAEIPEGGQASVAFCTDAQMRNEAFSVAAGADGRYAVVAEPGTYYVRVTIDRDGDDALGAGDMMGFFGVDDLLGGDEPAPVEVEESVLWTDMEVPISARIADDGRLTAYTADDDAADDEPGNAGE
ncbi:MAG: hypothetical protein ACLFU7_07375 [Armatimonadota bacterium]